MARRGIGSVGYSESCARVRCTETPLQGETARESEPTLWKTSSTSNRKSSGKNSRSKRQIVTATHNPIGVRVDRFCDCIDLVESQVHAAPISLATVGPKTPSRYFSAVSLWTSVVSQRSRVFHSTAQQSTADALEERRSLPPAYSDRGEEILRGGVALNAMPNEIQIRKPAMFKERAEWVRPKDEEYRKEVIGLLDRVNKSKEAST
jgi:hypothetical protein